MIVVDRVGFNFPSAPGKPIINNIAFELQNGEILAVVGPSGCGKTTLLRLLSGYLQATKGTILIDGKPTTSYGYTLGIAYQNSRLLPWRSVRDNISLPLEIAGSGLDGHNVSELMGRLRLTEHANKLPQHLSGGEQERTSLARALVAGPRVLLLDEPLDSTDYLHRLEIEDYLAHSVKETGMCCILVTHDLEQAVAFADRILLLGVTGSLQSMKLLDISQNIRESPPSSARLSATFSHCLSSLLVEYRKVVSSS